MELIVVLYVRLQRCCTGDGDLLPLGSAVCTFKVVFNLMVSTMWLFLILYLDWWFFLIRLFEPNEC